MEEEAEQEELGAADASAQIEAAHRRRAVRQAEVTMANPKRRTSRARRNRRRAHDALMAPSLSKCPQCGEDKRPHRVCPSCGTYRGVEILEIEGA